MAYLCLPQSNFLEGQPKRIVADDTETRTKWRSRKRISQQCTSGFSLGCFFAAFIFSHLLYTNHSAPRSLWWLFEVSQGSAMDVFFSIHVLWNNKARLLTNKGTQKEQRHFSCKLYRYFCTCFHATIFTRREKHNQIFCTNR